MLKFKASNLITETRSSTPPLPALCSLAKVFEWMNVDSSVRFTRFMEMLLYLYDKSVYVEARYTSVLFVVDEDFDFSMLKGVPFFYNRRMDADGHYFIHIHSSTVLALMFYEKFCCYKRDR